MQRCLLLFENAIKSDATRKLYVYYLNRFLKWAKLPHAGALLQLKDSHLQELLEDYVIDLRKRISPNSIPPIFAGLELFFVMNSKNLQFKKIRKMFPEKIKKSGSAAWTNEDIQKMLEFAKSRRNKALIHFITSTGCRVGVLPDLKHKHITEMSLGCKAVLIYEGTNEEYYSFLTPEASTALETYFEERRSHGEPLLPDSPVFSKISQSGVSQRHAPDLSSIKSIVLRIIRGSGVHRKRVHQRYEVQMDHGFRKRFNTILKTNDSANVSLCEKLLGHKGVFQLDGTYLKPSKDKLFEEFKKHITELTVSDEERDKVRIAKLEAEKSELQLKNSEIEQLKGSVSQLQDEVGRRKVATPATKADLQQLESKLRKLGIQLD